MSVSCRCGAPSPRSLSRRCAPSCASACHPGRASEWSRRRNTSARTSALRLVPGPGWRLWSPGAPGPALVRTLERPRSS
eukprot:11202415-Lingulodinium_polyedra.AAC.1